MLEECPAGMKALWSWAGWFLLQGHSFCCMNHKNQSIYVVFIVTDGVSCIDFTNSMSPIEKLYHDGMHMGDKILWQCCFNWKKKIPFQPLPQGLILSVWDCSQILFLFVYIWWHYCCHKICDRNVQFCHAFVLKFKKCSPNSRVKKMQSMHLLLHTEIVEVIPVLWNVWCI